MLWTPLWTEEWMGRGLPVGYRSQPPAGTSSR